MKIKNKTYKHVTIKIERVVEQKTEKGSTDQRTLYYLINATYGSGHGIGFRADTPLKAWSMLMSEVYL